MTGMPRSRVYDSEGGRRISLADWQVNNRQRDLCRKALNSGRLTYGPMTVRFEKEWAKLHGWEFGVMVNSGTNALKIALCALREMAPGLDEVLVPAVTFIATYNAVLMAGLRPRLIDIDDTLNMDMTLVGDGDELVLPVHLLGRPADMDALGGRIVIEDSCECAFIDTGMKGIAACYSFYTSHHLPTGVGGMICTNNPALAIRCRSFSFHGRDESYLSMDDRNISNTHLRFWFPRHGYSDRASELEAALGIGGLDTWQELLEQRLGNARYLADRLEQEFVDNHSYMFFPYFSDRRDELVQHLQRLGVETRSIMPLTNQPILAGKVTPGMFPVAERVNRTGLLLPCHPYLTNVQLNRIVQAVQSFK
jgi:dTDP-4-amino-4,6-dideoxygalactose transaminase